MHLRRRALTLALLFVLMPSTPALPAPGGAIVGVSLGNAAPVPGDTLVFETVVTASEPWPANTYSVHVEIRDERGAQMYAADAAGDAIAPGQTTAVFVPVKLDDASTGAYSAVATLLRDGTALDRSQAQTFVVSRQVTALQPAAVPAAAARVSPGWTLDGNLAVTTNFSGSQFAQNGTLSFDGKTDAGNYQSSGGLSNTPGASKPIFTFNTPASVVQLGTFAPSYDPLALDGVVGEGVAVKHAYGETHELSLSAILAAPGTLNPFDVDALSYVMPVSGTTTKLRATLGHVNVLGSAPAFETLPFVDRGDFGALTLTKSDPASPFGYTLRFSTIAFVDKVSLQHRSGSALEAQAHTTTGKAAWSLDVTRASAFFPTLTAPSVQADRQTETLGLSLPIGAVSASLNVNGYNDNLAGANLPQTTHYWTQSLSFNAPLRNGDTMALSLSGGAQHQAANTLLYPDAVDAANANDATSLQYSGRRGAFNFAGSIGYNNQHDLLGNLQHSTQDNLSFGRTVAQGLSATATLNLTTNVSAAAESTNSVFAKALNLSYAVGAFTYQAGITQARTRPYLGLRPADSSSETFGWTYALGHNFQLQLNLASTASGAAQATQGSVNVTQRF